MGDAYYIGNLRHSKQRKMKKRHQLLILLALLLLLFVLLCRFSLYPYIEARVESETKKRVTAICAEKISEIFSDERYNYEDFIRLEYTADGRVASARINTVTLNLLRYQIAKAILSSLQTQAITVSVPISNFLGVIFFSGTSGGYPITVETADSMLASFSSRFEECGINQTRHLITFDFSIEVYFLLPVRYRTLTLTASVSAAETLIVGEVPDTFTDINRLTDDVSEIDIDDVVDFGNIL